MRSRIVQLLLAGSFAWALAASAFVGTAYACDCAINPPDQSLAQADFAFEGTVASVAIPPSAPGRDTSLDPIAVTFTVDTLLKAPPDASVGPEILVSTANNGGACGVAFSPGERWRVYATVVAAGSNPVTSSCAGDQLLGAGTIPERSAAGPPVTLLVLGGITALLVAFSAWAFTRQPRGGSA